MDNHKLVNELVAKLSYFAQEYGVDSMFVVGNFCLNLYTGWSQDLDKIEVCVAHEGQTMQLASLFATEINESTVRQDDETNSAVIPGDVSIEFQSGSSNQYMYNQEVQIWMQQDKIEQIPILYNLYGREFTIHALAYSLYNERMYDQTGLAAKDIDDKKIITMIPPTMLLKYKPIAILDAIAFSLTNEFHIDPELRTVMKEGSYLLPQYLSIDRIVSAIVGILKIDSTEGLEMIENYGLSEYLLTPEIKRHLSKEEDND